MYARNFYEYYKYSDLEHFIRINPVSKRCAVSIGNILCEYYTVPRLITDKQPCGYTAYTSHTIYDISFRIFSIVLCMISSMNHIQLFFTATTIIKSVCHR